MAVAAFIASTLGTALLRKIAIKINFVDNPGHRKIHQEPIALGGGIVIFIIVVGPLAITLALAYYFNNTSIPTWLPQSIAIHIPGIITKTTPLLTLIIAAAILHITGLVDDKKNLGPLVKLFIQLTVAILLVTVGQTKFSFFIPSPITTTVLSVVWIIAIINAFNFLDNMDGLSAGIAAICSSIILIAALSSGQVFISAILILLIAALLGFLIFNFSPATIFMGDAGSLLVGMFIAVATIQTTYYHQGTPDGLWFTAFMPVIALAVPLYDFVGVTIIRLMQGASPLVGDKQHFSHRLVNRGMTQRQAVLTIYLATAGTGLGAALLPNLQMPQAIMVFIQTILIVLIIAILEQPQKHLRPEK